MTRGAKVAVAVILGGIALAVISVKTRSSRGQVVAVRMEPVGRRDLVAVVTASGQIEAKSDVDVSSDVQARITAIHVKEGDYVHKGELLVELDQSQFRGAVDRAQAGLKQMQALQAQAQANRDQAKRNLDRTLELKKAAPTLTTDESVEQAQSAYSVAQANYEAAVANVGNAQASLTEAQDNLDRTRIVAPIDGKVVELPKKEGEVAVPGTFSSEQALLMRIADMSTIIAKVKVDETDIVRLKLGDSVSVAIDAFPDTTFAGTVTKIGNAASATSAGAGTTGAADQAIDFDVEATLTHPPRDIRPDLSMTARIVTDTRQNALSIPIIALTARPVPHASSDTGTSAAITTTMKPGDTVETTRVKEIDGVFRVQNGVAYFTPVTVGIAGDEYFEVLSGLKEGDTVVSGTYQAIRDMKDSTRVKPAPEVKTP
jgi:HlyD family secretion protein